MSIQASNPILVPTGVGRANRLLEPALRCCCQSEVVVRVEVAGSGKTQTPPGVQGVESKPRYTRAGQLARGCRGFGICRGSHSGSVTNGTKKGILRGQSMTEREDHCQWECFDL